LRYEVWAPSELTELHAILAANDYGVSSSRENEQTKAYARKRGFKTLRALVEYEKNKQETLYRLISRPEMEGFWQWAARDSKGNLDSGWLFGRFSGHMHSWIACAPFSKSERYDELMQISHLARELANKLENFALEPFLNFGYQFLLREGEVEQIKTVLKPDFLGKISRRRYDPANMGGGIANNVMPPLDVLLTRLSRVAKNATTDDFFHPKLPRKMRDKNALRTFLIGQLYWDLVIQECDPSPSKLATFLSVALDDAELTTDVVRKLIPRAGQKEEAREKGRT
jgi:hypothetical protein